ncbi:hypothetical protein FRC08_003809 [Ceratobasidium sp. 394]|nr:hypothetical protein FRC08_003809 [Ceratobasidium sp. 394]
MSSPSSPSSPQPSHAGSSHEVPEPATLHLEPNDSPAPPVIAVPATPLTLDDALTRVQSLPGWIGNSIVLTRDAEWVEDSQSRSMFLRPKPGVSEAGFQVDESGNVRVSWIGVVGARDSTITPHGDFRPWFRDPERHKRVVRTIRPPPGLSQALDKMWTDQLKGAKVVAERARQMENGGEPKLSYCFLEEEPAGALKARSALFQHNGSPWEGDTPEGFQYSTWKMPDNVRPIFDGVRSNNNTPRVLEAYDALDNLIHPNDVPRRLISSIVVVTCTLEKLLFKGPKIPGGRQWQIYANITKVQVVGPNPTPSPPLASSSKRKASELDDADAPNRPLKHFASVV